MGLGILIMLIITMYYHYQPFRERASIQTNIVQASLLAVVSSQKQAPNSQKPNFRVRALSRAVPSRIVDISCIVSVRCMMYDV
jgi:hypothetical protein